MLKQAHLITNSKEINTMIAEASFPFVCYSNYKYFDIVEIEDGEWNYMQYVSLSRDNKILGFFQASVNQPQRKISSTLFIKFRHLCTSKEDKLTLDNDFNTFVDNIMNHPIYDRISFTAIADNHANRTYEELIEKYDGRRMLLEDYVMLKDGRYYDVWQYYFNRRE